MKNVTKAKEQSIAKKANAKKEAGETLARAKKVLAEKPLTTTKVTPKGTTTKTQDNATLKVVKETPRGNTVREKNYIYSFQMDEKLKLTAKQEKRMRGKIRRQLKAIVDAIILLNAKKKDTSKVKDFMSFYKANYILNDLSLQSITNSSDDLKQHDLNRVLALAKEVAGSK